MEETKIRIDSLYGYQHPIPQNICTIIGELSHVKEHQNNKRWLSIAIKAALTIGCIFALYSIYSSNSAIEENIYEKEAQDILKH